jgi:hypothetical protein
LALHYCFLETLFLQVLGRLKDYEEGDAQQIASRWYQWLKIDSSANDVGSNRTGLYQQVVDKAKRTQVTTGNQLMTSNLSTTTKQTTEDDILKAQQENMVAAAMNLVTRLKQLHGEIDDQFSAIVYFDEAHTLQDVVTGVDLKGKKIQSPYFTLMSALNALCEVPIFFVFLSTDSSLHTFTPQISIVSSFHIQGGLKLIQPYFKLPFDTFAVGATMEAEEAGELTLSKVCQLNHITKFGRPL